MYFRLSIFDGEKFEETAGTVDALCDRQGVYDLDEAMTATFRLIGKPELKAGIQYNGKFVTLQDLIDWMDDDEDDEIPFIVRELTKGKK